MKRIVGILAIVLVLYGVMLTSRSGRTADRHRDMAERLALYGVLTLGVGVLIVSGGIDLSIGAVFCLGAVSLGLLLKHRLVPPAAAVLIVLAGGATIGLIHGLLITRLRLQPFIVTLCGLFIWRGLAYWLALPDPLAVFRGVKTGSAGTVGIAEQVPEFRGLVTAAAGNFELSFLSGVPVLEWFRFVPFRLVLLLVLAGALAVLMHASVYGRYLFAVGANEQAARYAGIRTDRYKVFAYVLCSMLAALGGMLEVLDLKTSSPSSTGQNYELYAITGAVLGGCSLRGGEGMVLGILLGTAVLPLLRTLCNTYLPSDLEYLVIGLALVAGTIADELVKRRGQRRT